MDNQRSTFFILGVPAFLRCCLAMPSVCGCNASALFVFLLVAKGASRSLFSAYKKYQKNLRHFHLHPHAKLAFKTTIFYTIEIKTNQSAFLQWVRQNTTTKKSQFLKLWRDQNFSLDSLKRHK